jgi:uncharacterized protein YhhL (DUF1145 family)
MICDKRSVMYYTIIALHWVQCEVLWSTEKQYWRRPKLTKAEGRSQYCFSVLHNTPYCTKWSAVIVLLHLTFPIFFVYLDKFLGIVCCFYSNSKTHELIHLISYTHILIHCVQIYITNSTCTNFYPAISTFAVQICYMNKFLLYSY